MYALLKAVIDLCLLRIGPQNLPPANVLLWLFVAIYLVINFFTALVSLPPVKAAGASILDVLMVAAFIQAMLKITHKQERFTQTLTATLAAWSLLGLLVLPVAYVMQGEGFQGRETTYLVLGLTVYLAWSLAVLGSILRHALDFPLYGGIGLSVLYFMLSQMIMAAVFPPTG